MKKNIFSLAMLMAMAALFAPQASALDIKNILGGDAGNVVTNLIEGVLTKTDISVADMAGTYTVSGSAVSFKSENALAKAGGVAAAAAVEAKLDPYYKKYGLTGGEMVINADGTFNMTIKKIPLSGTITKKDDGSFLFNFKTMGMSVFSVDAYAQKSVSNLELMFDATKLKSLLEFVGNLTKMEMANTVVSLLKNYDGILVGFSMTQTSAAPTPSSTSEQSSGFSLPSILSGGSSNSSTNSSGSSNSSNTQSTGTSNQNTQTQQAVNGILNLLKTKK